ncbi:hypothetical protein Ae201684P_019441 [Aphanomyces euteiches]|nr:hypothetical protein Ae201684P_019441 [Aphanomyces euteiches]KAH9149762.1 hypothetical protein AeRB84_007276 [Aphanomyces euteiches]
MFPREPYKELSKKTPWLKHKKRKKTPCLIAKHMQQRMAYARKHTIAQKDFSRIIWSDEKRFNLDGPDGFQYYWHDLRKEPDSFLTRQNGGRGVMIWVAFSKFVLSELAFLKGNQTYVMYVDTLSSYLMPYVHLHVDESLQFMQDGASIHRGKVVYEFLEEQGVALYDHPLFPLT